MEIMVDTSVTDMMMIFIDFGFLLHVFAVCTYSTGSINQYICAGTAVGPQYSFTPLHECCSLFSRLKLIKVDMYKYK